MKNNKGRIWICNPFLQIEKMISPKTFPHCYSLQWKKGRLRSSTVPSKKESAYLLHKALKDIKEMKQKIRGLEKDIIPKEDLMIKDFDDLFNKKIDDYRNLFIFPDGSWTICRECLGDEKYFTIEFKKFENFTYNELKYILDGIVMNLNKDSK